MTDTSRNSPNGLDMLPRTAQLSYSMYGQEGGVGMGGGRIGGRRHLEDIVEGKLFLGGIEQDMSQEQLHNYCGGWGQVTDAFVSPKGFGFVTFANIQDAFNFLEHEPHQINSRTVEVKAAIPKSRGGGQKATNKLFVGGVPRDVDSDEFKEHFAQYGNIEDAAIVRDANGVSRGFGFVTYDNTKSIEKALIVKHLLNDRVVDCKRAVPKDELRTQSGGSYGAAYGNGYNMNVNYAAGGGGGGGRDRGYGSNMNGGAYGMGAMNGYGMGAYGMGAMNGYGMGAYGMGLYGGYGMDGMGVGFGMGGMGAGGGMGGGGYNGSGMGSGGYGARNNGNARTEGRQGTRYQPY